MTLSRHPPAGGDEGPGQLIGPAFTDLAGDQGTQPQLARLLARYEWVRQRCTGQRVVEIACGSGQGLGLLARSARSVIGADYSTDNLAIARKTYGSRLPLVRLDAQRLPIRDTSVDVVVLLETLYFLPSPDRFVAEVARVLVPGGRLLLSVINKDCWDFNPSPLYPEFFGTVELAALLRRHGLDVQTFGDFPLDQPSVRQRLFRPLKDFAVRFNLIPRTVQARQWLKRIAIGRLVPLPFEILPGSSRAIPPVEVDPHLPDPVHQVMLAIGRRSAGAPTPSSP